MTILSEIEDGAEPQKSFISTFDVMHDKALDERLYDSAYNFVKSRRGLTY